MGNYSRYWDQRVHQISAQHMQVHMLGLRRRLNHVKRPEMSWGYGTNCSVPQPLERVGWRHQTPRSQAAGTSQ